jgi:hypothetical protein
MVDTKSVNNTTLLHFLEKTVSKHFVEMEAFLDELEKPAEAYRGQYKHIEPFIGLLTKLSQSIYKTFAKASLSYEMV